MNEISSKYASKEFDKFLTDLLSKPFCEKQKKILLNAAYLVYHDEESNLTTPKTQLIMDLKDAGYNDMALKAAKGKYDF